MANTIQCILFLQLTVCYMTCSWAMMAISRQYVPEVYNSLGDIDKMDAEVNEKTKLDKGILELGGIILQYGHEKEVVVIKAHRHFNLRPDEAMLEQRAPNGQRGFDTAPVSLSRIAELDAKPNVIALGDDMVNWYPVGYAVDVPEPKAWEDGAFFAGMCYIFKKA